MPQISSYGVVDVYPFCISNGRVQYLSLLRSPGTALGETWQAVHGRIQKRETAVRAAVREVLAQTGTQPISLWNIDYVNSFYVPEEDAIYLVPSIGAQLPPDSAVQLTPDHVNWEWAPAEVTMRRFLWVGQRLALQSLHEDIAGPMASGRLSNPYLEINPKLYMRGKRGFG